jgi:hypothetical protein
MNLSRSLIPAAIFGLVSAVPAHAAVLDVVNVAAPAVNCHFNTSCTVTVSDSIGNFTPPGDVGTGRLQSRTYPGTAPAPMAGKLAYVYRVDMTSVSAPTVANCVTAIQFTFGTVTKGPYGPGGALKDMFVVTTGGLGNVGVATAVKTGATIVINFAGSGVCPGQTSYFMGLASTDTMPSNMTAKLFYSAGGSGTPAANVNIRVP